MNTKLIIHLKPDIRHEIALANEADAQVMINALYIGFYGINHLVRLGQSEQDVIGLIDASLLISAWVEVSS